MRRAVLLALAIALGCTVGFVGWLLSGNQWWYLAIPGTLAAAWLVVADPERCLARENHTAPHSDHCAR